jgi:hypothetical protein
MVNELRLNFDAAIAALPQGNAGRDLPFHEFARNENRETDTDYSELKTDN